MLRVSTYLDRSPIHGIGLFSKDPICKGHLVWQFDLHMDRIFRADWSELDPLGLKYKTELRNFLDTYSTLDANKLWRVLCLDDARFMNHSESPNLVSNAWHLDELPGDGILYDAAKFARRDIEPGEELTIHYHTICAEFKGF